LRRLLNQSLQKIIKGCGSGDKPPPNIVAATRQAVIRQGADWIKAERLIAKYERGEEQAGIGGDKRGHRGCWRARG